MLLFLQSELSWRRYSWSKFNDDVIMTSRVQRMVGLLTGNLGSEETERNAIKHRKLLFSDPKMTLFGDMFPFLCFQSLFEWFPHTKYRKLIPGRAAGLPVNSPTILWTRDVIMTSSLNFDQEYLRQESSDCRNNNINRFHSENSTEYQILFLSYTPHLTTDTKTREIFAFRSFSCTSMILAFFIWKTKNRGNASSAQKIT